jgi:predicted enzyme related to lactoylglutathione lyase
MKKRMQHTAPNVDDMDVKRPLARKGGDSMNQAKTATAKKGGDSVNQTMHLLVYPTKDIDKAKALFQELLGVEPYVDSGYYTGFRTGDLEIGLDPNGRHSGPIAYWEVSDIRGRLQQLLDAGGQLEQDVRDVGRGLQIATVKDADGNTIGLRQTP